MNSMRLSFRDFVLNSAKLFAPSIPRYSYKFIVGGQWRHSTSLPTESDQGGNINNVIRIGDTARIRFFGTAQQHIKVSIVPLAFHFLVY